MNGNWSAPFHSVIPLLFHNASLHQRLLISYALVFLICLPNLNSTHGTGISPTAMNPNRLVAQSIPKFRYIWRVNKGKTPPSV